MRSIGLALALQVVLGCNLVLGYEEASLAPEPTGTDAAAPVVADDAAAALGAVETPQAPVASAPIELARGLDRPTQLVLTGKTLRWLEPDGVHAIDIATPKAAPRTVVAMGGVLAHATLGSRVHFTVRGKDGLYAADEGVPPAVLFEDPHDPRAVAVAGSRVIVSQSEKDHGKIYWRDGTQLDNESVPNGDEPWALATNEVGDAYFVTRLESCDGGRVYRLAKPPVLLSSAETCPTALVATGQDVFVVNGIVDGTVRRFRANVAPVDIATKQGEPVAIAASSEFVVWANRASGQIVRAHRTTGAVTVLVRSLVAPTGVAIDASAARVFFVVQGSGDKTGALFETKL